MSNPTVNLAKEFWKKLIDDNSTTKKFCEENGIDGRVFRNAINGYDCFLTNYHTIVEKYLEEK
jgi:hypothetical protein